MGRPAPGEVKLEIGKGVGWCAVQCKGERKGKKKEASPARVGEYHGGVYKKWKCFSRNADTECFQRRRGTVEDRGQGSRMQRGKTPTLLQIPTIVTGLFPRIPSCGRSWCVAHGMSDIWGDISLLPVMAVVLAAIWYDES